MKDLEKALAPYDLSVICAGDRLAVTYGPCDQAVMVGTESDCEVLLAMLVSERLRIVSELVADAGEGLLDGFEGDLEAVCDPVTYLAGARSDGGYGDERQGRSDARAARHAGYLVSFGMIGRGVEKVDPDNVDASDAYACFINGVSTAVRAWIDDGNLDAFIGRRHAMAR